MEKKYMERLVGKYCKIVTKEPGEERASVVTGILEDVDYKDGFILVDSEQGLGCLRINTIVAIKPGKKRIGDKYKNNDNNDKAVVGIGTMIVFISMVLVAAVAASVLITTSEHLQRRAQTVGDETIREVSSGLMIEDITGYTNSNRTRIQYMALTVRPRAGSQNFELDLLALSFRYDELHVLKLNTSLIQEVNLDNASIFKTPVSSGSDTYMINITDANEFGIISIHDYDGSVMSTRGMNTGDRIMVLMNLSALIPDTNGLPTRERISGEIKPEIGAPGIYQITAPAVFIEKVIDLW
jgi:flagellin FlaB